MIRRVVGAKSGHRGARQEIAFGFVVTNAAVCENGWRCILVREPSETIGAGMTTGNVIIVGGGQAGVQAAVTLRELGFAGAIGLFCAENYLPYQRPPLSKTYLKEDSPPEKMYLRLRRS